jgi:hypothetical protein
VRENGLSVWRGEAAPCPTATASSTSANRSRSKLINLGKVGSRQPCSLSGGSPFLSAIAWRVGNLSA